jgi:hypothetical protein
LRLLCDFALWRRSRGLRHAARRRRRAAEDRTARRSLPPGRRGARWRARQAARAGLVRWIARTSRGRGIGARRVVRVRVRCGRREWRFSRGLAAGVAVGWRFVRRHRRCDQLCSALCRCAGGCPCCGLGLGIGSLRRALWRAAEDRPAQNHRLRRSVGGFDWRRRARAWGAFRRLGLLRLGWLLLAGHWISGSARKQ